MASGILGLLSEGWGAARLYVGMLREALIGTVTGRELPTRHQPLERTPPSPNCCGPGSPSGGHCPLSQSWDQERLCLASRDLGPAPPETPPPHGTAVFLEGGFQKAGD